MAGFDLTAANAILKENYNDNLLSDLVPKSHPLLYFLPKAPDFTGTNYIQPVKYGNPQSIISGSSGFSNLISNPLASKLVRFAMTSTKHYGVIQIDRETILATSNDEGAFVSALDFEVGNVVAELGRDLGRQAFGNTSGNMGTVSGSVASHVITLTKVGDAARFEVGMVLTSYTDETLGTQHDAALVVTKVDENAGTLTVTGDSATVNADILVRQNSGGNEWAGLRSWIPTSAPSSTAFFGVDRTASSRLAGQRIDGSTLQITDALNKAAMLVEKQGGQPSHIFCSFEYFYAIANSEQVQKRYPQPGANEAQIGFAGIQIVTPYGMAMLYPDRFCDQDKIYVLSMDSWKLISRENLVHWVNEDGTMILRTSSDDSFQGRIASYSNILCKNPVANCVIYNLPVPT